MRFHHPRFVGTSQEPVPPKPLIEPRIPALQLTACQAGVALLVFCECLSHFLTREGRLNR
jgi:hypothetical protein